MLALALMVIVVARVVVPSAPPLYDGIVPVEPYVWLDPPAGHPGGAKGAKVEIPVRVGAGPLVSVATPELVPQAQIFAEPGALTLRPGSSAIKVSIEPVQVEGTVTDGHIDGNVYRITVTDDTGAALTAPASAGVSVVLRASDPVTAKATVARLSGGSWDPLKTSTGFGGSFIAVVTGFGDFALIAPGPGPGASATAAPIPSTRSSDVAAVGSPIMPSQTAVTSAPSTTAAPSSSPDWSLIALAVIAVLIAILGFDLVRRWGSHR